MTLRQEIDAFVADSASRIPPDVIAKLQQSIDQVRESGVVERALGVGDLAPDFALPNALGRPVALADLLQHGPLILSFYRGVWCPYCNLELKAYQRILPAIRAAGGNLVAISPQTPDNSLTTTQKNELEFEVLSDVGNRVAAEFGIAYRTPEIVKRITSSFGVDLAAMNGNAGDDRLPISATYVIGSDRIIALANIDADFRVRLEPTEALAALQKLSAAAPAGRLVRA
jgi:peroxiredoxin